ncbi:TonB-dependent receptor family protein [Marilutibacter aestuarii]|uniref:TonB-dependent receptor n=1 Tax=Marilutibacter aestuarii TaxID=1706195 RepID=A0A508AGE1_9GAMM|nr:TonB-dependent receptor [Lysobacter aestuarii]TQD48916.1 TonB-dependent receptor [Lysobacter aestuarii]
MSIPVSATPRASRMAVAVCLSLSLSLVSRPAAAGGDDDPGAATLDTVVVRGERPATVESLQQARDRLSQRAGGTAIIDADTYRDGRASTMADALGYAPGVFIQSRFGAEEARLSIRGSGLQRTFHGRGIELMQDGSPLNLADGSFDFQAVEPLSARYVEVYRGANALEYGAATLGGAVNFVSPTGHDAAALTGRMEAGSSGYRRGQVATAGSRGDADGYASLTAFEQDGFRDHAVQENYRLFANAGYRFNDTLDGRLYYTHVDTDSQLPGSLTRAQAYADPRQAAAGSVVLDQKRDFRLDRVAGRLAWTPGDGRKLSLSLYYADKSLDHPIFQVLRQDTRDYGMDLRWQASGALAGHRNELVAGLAYGRGDTTDARFLNLGGTAGARTNGYAQHASNAKAYLENQAWLTDRWTLVMGAQGLKSVRNLRDTFVTALDESFREDYSGFSPKLGTRFIVDERLQFFGNLSRSMEPPSFGELAGGPNVTRNDAQRATTAELGMRIQRAGLSLDAAVYRARVEEELLSLSDGDGNPLGTVNADHTLHQGVELGLDWAFANRWKLSANYLLNDFRFDHDPVYGDNTLAGVPRQQVRMALRWSPGPVFHVAPQVEWVPQDYYIDHANTFTAPGYALLGLKLGGDIGSGASWFVDARNLADRKWISTTGVIADAGGQDSAQFLPGDGRSVYAGLQWAWQ